MKHRFYALHEGFYEGVDRRLQVLRRACDLRGIEFHALDSLCVDYSDLPHLGLGDLLYNCARGSQVLESLLINERVTTFYIRNPAYVSLASMTTLGIVHERAGLPAPKTIYALTADRSLLKRYVEYLGGFPLILKVEGGTRGIGVIKVDSWPGLISLADHLVTSGQRFILRQFIDAPYGVRAMVLGERVVGALKFLLPAGDFRNAALLTDIRYEPIQLSPADEALCIEATRLANVEMSGVDLLYDRAGKSYLLEINFPTGFQSFSAEPWRIHEQWVDHLIAKCRRHIASASMIERDDGFRS